VFAAIRGYHRRRGWLAWHTAMLSRTAEFPELHEMTGQTPQFEDTDEDRAERSLRNSRAWVIVTGGAKTEPAAEPEGTA
jgi:hypothetical protein